jgi:hypothetical protein
MFITELEDSVSSIIVTPPFSILKVLMILELSFDIFEEIR